MQQEKSYSTFELIGRTLEYVKPFKWMLLATILLNSVFSIITAGTVALIKFVFSALFEVEIDTNSTQAASGFLDNMKDSFYHTVNSFLGAEASIEERLLNLAILLISLFVLKNIFKYFSSVLTCRLEEGIIKSIRDHLFSSITALSLDFFSKSRQGNLMSAISNDVAVLNSRTIMASSAILRELVQVIFFLFLLIAISPKLTLIAFSTSIVSLLVLQFAVKFLKRYASRMQNAMANYTSTMQESISGIKVIQAYNAQKVANDKFKKDSEVYVNSAVKHQKIITLIPAINEVFAIVALCVVLIIGGYEVLVHKTVKADDLMTFLIMLFSIMSPISSITSMISNMPSGLVAGERVFKIIDRKPTVLDGANEIKGFQSSIELKNITFAYQENTVLKDINLKIEKGKKIAFVGASGSGKSTILDMIVRFYDPQQGKVMLDGADIKDFKLDSYRSLFGIVSQETILFNDTVANNIKYGNPSKSLDDIIAVAKISNSYKFIDNLPEKFDTFVGDRGVMLSGGERQRIAIARALLRNPEILVFDEATSALDSESEKIVQQAINEALKGKTAIIVAHRLATIIDCDEIYVFEQGQIVESGKHQELLDKQGIYRKLYDIQFAAE